MPQVKPVTDEDKALSIKHLRGSIKFNEAHAADHMKAATASRKKLGSASYLGSGTPTAFKEH